jgi:serine/threonine protein kinase
LLHNELIPEIPFKLKVKMAFQAAKGMHFLHSSGIVHRDLKSLNLLLDAKWNVKVKVGTSPSTSPSSPAATWSRPLGSDSLRSR